MTAGAPSVLSALLVEQLDIRYAGAAGSVHAVDGVDLRIEPGEVVGIVGESGSGKSSICHALLGMVGDRASLTATRIEIAGHDLTRARERQWRAHRGSTIAFVPQQPMTALAPTVAVGRQLDWHLGSGAVETHREALLGLGLQALLDRPDGLPGTFSGGQLQRVLIAMATLGGSPSLIVADEPTSTLDATVAATVVEVLLARQRELGAGMLYVSHDLATVASVARRVVVMHRGVAVETGPVADVFGDPQHSYTRALLEALPRPRSARAPDTADSTTPCARRIDVDSTRTESDDDPSSTAVGVRLDHVYRYFGRATAGRPGPPVVRAVDDVSLALPAGSITALVGESGSGKTTLARILAGADTATAGDVVVGGQVLSATRTASQRRAVQLVSQNHRAALNHRRTVAHALVQVQRVHGIGTDRADRLDRAAALLQRVGLARDHLQRRPRQLSGGEAARVALARSLLLGPDVLVLDEPTAGLDTRVRASVIELLAGLRQELGLTVLLITHELPVADALADHVAVMHDGQLVEHGPADLVLHHPTDPSTRTLLASVPPDPRTLAPS
jgi:peptide/nickel transport system ATP-binding protein